MTRAKVTVKRLVEEEGLDLDVALLLLMDGNFNVESGSDFIVHGDATFLPDSMPN